MINWDRERQPGRRTRSIILQRGQDVRCLIKSPKKKCCYLSSRDSWGKLETLANMCMSLTGPQVTLTETLVLSLQEEGVPDKIGRLASLGRRDWRRTGWSQAEEWSGSQMPRVLILRELLWPVISPRQWGLGFHALCWASIMKSALHPRELERTGGKSQESLEKKKLRLKATDLGIKKNSRLPYTLLLPQDNLVEWGIVCDILWGVSMAN